MKSLSLVCLALLATGALASYCNSGSSFPEDCEDRQKNRGCLTGGGSHHPKTTKAPKTTTKATTTKATTIAEVTETTIYSSTYGQCSCSCEGSGSDESSGDDGSSGDDDSSGSGSEEDSGSDEESGSGSGLLPYDDYCLILQYFYNISIQITDVQIRYEWIEFINECQYEIIYDESLTEDQKLIAIYSKLQIFLSIHVEIQELVLYTYIVEWEGYIFDLEALCVFIQYQFTQAIIELDFTGSCVLFEALLNATQGTAIYAKIQILIEEITIILEGSYTYSYQLVLIYEKFTAFFEANIEWKSFILEIEIEGYGSCFSFYTVIATYWRVENYAIAVGGSVDECALIQVLIDCYNNASTGSASKRSQIKQLTDKLVAKWQETTVISVRVEYFVAQVYQFLILEEWCVQILFSLEIEGYGSIYELILAFSFQHQCGCIDFGTTAAPTTTPAIETTEAETTTTTQAPTTTHPQGECSTVLQSVKFQNNITDLSWSIDEAQKSWNETEIQRFATYEKRVWVVTSNSTATRQQVFANLVNVFNSWTTNEFYLNLVYSVKIQIFHATSSQYYWGTIKQFCGCSGQV